MSMPIRASISFFIVIFINLFVFSVSECNNNASFTSNSVYQRNLDDALSYITSDTSITYGFYNRSIGETPDKANVMALCRGDIEPYDCRRCINASSRGLRENCPNQKGAIDLQYSGSCMVRYSNETILGDVDTSSILCICNPYNASDVDRFNQALSQLLNQLRTDASSGGSHRKYASGNNTNGPSLTTIYGLMQCTPDLSEDQCFDCLNSAMQRIPNCCDSKRGGRVIFPSCNLWYEEFRFFNDIVSLPPPPLPPPPPIELSPPPLQPPSVSEEYRANCVADFNFTTQSAYQINRDDAFSSVTTSDPKNTYGFYNRFVGESPDRVHVIALCRGDVIKEDCQRCINEYGVILREFCPNQKRGNIIYDTCMIRYSDQILIDSTNFVDGWDSSDGWGPENHENASDVNQFTQALDRLWVQLRDEASSGGPLRKYASNVTNGPRSTKIYGLMQCTPDMSGTECYNCLSNAINRTRSCCDGRRGGRVLYLSCNIRYQDYPFFNATVSLEPPSSAPLPPSELPPSGKDNNTTIIVIIVVAIVSLLILVVVFFGVLMRRKRKLKGLQQENLVHEDTDLDEIITAESLQHSFSVIRAATDDFSENNKLGQGGFGLVYKGKLQNGQEIAVKRLSKDSGQGELEFKNEVLLLARLQHRNLVRLLGFGLEGSERLLMYEFVQNASLDQFIFDPEKRATLDWQTRYKIIHGVARGLLYLHEDSRLKIIHRDMKASNVLLDAGMNAKIADFGMARLFTSEETQDNTSRIVGTYGYMAPEYILHGQFSVKSDVFSFGVLILEIVTGHKNHSFKNGMMTEDLLSHAWKSWRDGTSTSLIDPTLNDGSNFVRDMIRCIHIGLLCVQEDVTERPTMASVVLMLSSLSLTLAVPLEPAFFMRTFKNSGKLFSNEYTSSTNDSHPLKGKSRSSQRSVASSQRSIESSQPSIADDASMNDLYSR